MKLIITGATGFVATELVRQSLQHPRISTVVAVARKPVPVPEGIDGAKLRNVIIEDYNQYPETVRGEFAGASACIWTVAVGPWKARCYPDFETVRKVSQDYTIAGLQAMHEAGTNKPFRFLYLSGSTTERDQSKSHLIGNQYRLMRGEGENQVLKFAADHPGEVEAVVAKPGLITTTKTVYATAISGVAALGLFESISLEDLARALIDQAVHGFESDPLLTSDLNRIAQKAKAS